MYLLIWTVFSGERCVPWASCFSSVFEVTSCNNSFMKHLVPFKHILSKIIEKDFHQKIGTQELISIKSFTIFFYIKWIQISKKKYFIKTVLSKRKNEQLQKQLLCELCRYGNIQTEATSFCKTCEEPELLCKDCAIQHTRQRATKGHEICSDIEQFPTPGEILLQR